MPTVVPLYKRTQRKRSSSTSRSGTGDGGTSLASSSRVTSKAGTVISTPSESPTPSGSTCHGGHGKNCFLCRKGIKYYEEVLTCGHQYHADCYWRWIRVRSNLPEEKSICPKCGFLETPSKWTKGRDRIMAGTSSLVISSGKRRTRKNSSSSDDSSSSSDSDTNMSTGSSSSSSSRSSSRSTFSDIFFL